MSRPRHPVPSHRPGPSAARRIPQGTNELETLGGCHGQHPVARAVGRLAQLLRDRRPLRCIDDPNGVSAPERGLQAWSDLENRMAKVARNRNAFAHRMMERGDLPPHYGQGIPYVALSDDELDDQAREAFTATELCRQLVERLQLAPLNPGIHFGRREPESPN